MSAPGTLPHIQNHLPADTLHWVTFTKPAPDSEIFAVDGESIISPASTILGLRLLKLKTGMVVPFHRHEKKEKVYIGKGAGELVVCLFIKETLHTVSLRKDVRVIVPPGCPHALYCKDSCETLVITSNKDATDIVWQDGLEELLKNEHLKK